MYIHMCVAREAERSERKCLLEFLKPYASILESILTHCFRNRPNLVCPY